MAIVITVETGAGVPNANSYETLTNVKTFCTDRGFVLPSNDETTKAAMLLAMDYIEAFRAEFKGIKTASSQSLAFPRERMRLDGTLIANNVIPTTLKMTQCRCTYELTNGTILQNVIDGIAIQEETIGPITVKYQDFLQTVDGKRIIEAIDGFLRPLLIENSGYRLGRHGY